MTYGIIIQPRAERDLRSLGPDIRNRIVDKVRGLENNPRPRGVIKVKGRDEYRLRVGDYRVLYTIDDNSRTVFIERAGHRREIYG